MGRKHGLVVIYDPHNLYQFLWYYSTYGKEMVWDALCLPNSYKGEYLSGTCGKLGIFRNIYTDTKPFDSLPILSRLLLFCKMFFSALFGKQRQFARRFICGYTGKLDFDAAVILTDVGFISGMFCLLADHKDVVILEDGMGDYINRKYSNIFSHLHNFFDLQGFMLSALGYSNTGHYFPLRTTKQCTKFSSHPDKMAYRNYKVIKTLFDMTLTDDVLFRRLVKSAWTGVAEYFSRPVEAMLFTTPLTDYVKDAQPYISLIEGYINEHVSSLMLKRHPRDTAEYRFCRDVHVVDIDQSIPTEVLLPFLKDIKIFFCRHSAINLYTASFNHTASFFYFKQLHQKSASETNVLDKYKSIEALKKELSFFGVNANIIEL